MSAIGTVGVLQRWARTIFSLDLRSLGLFRIGLGLVVVADAVFRLMDVELFYADSGARPRELIFKTFATRPLPSLYLLNGSVAFAAGLLALTVASGAALALGWRTRVAAVLAWALVLSVQSRNTAITTGADGVLLLMCTFALFLPVAGRFSLDVHRHPERVPNETVVLSAATVGLVLQLGVIYVFNVINKTGESWRDGTAVLKTLHIDQHATPLGALLLEHAPWVSPPLTYGTLIVEGAVVLLLVPFARDRIRVVLIAAMWLLHAGLGATLYLGLFSPVCMVAWLAILPPLAWTRGPLQRIAHPPAGASSSSSSSSSKWPVFSVVAVACVVTLQLWVNVGHVIQRPLPGIADGAAKILAVDQVWKMFASPSPHDGWFVIPGTLASGRTVDLFQAGAPVSEAKPRYVSHMYKTARWRKYMMGHSNEKGGSAGRKQYASWLCRTWNAAHDDDDRLLDLTMVFMLEKTRKSFKIPKPTKMELLKYTCSAKDERPRR
ncbi:MAG: HTTM domain-containing protein [Deltaproteobacteria bacterium]|nr:HTTM domain-containing protein [Deltaproteobacteria bacterium]